MRFKSRITLSILLLLAGAFAPAKSFAASSDSVVIKVTVEKNVPPEIESMDPKNNSRFIEGNQINIQVQAKDINGDTMEYRFLIEGQIMQDWSPSQNYLWQTQEGDVQAKHIRAEVKDVYDNMASQEIEVFLFRKSPLPELE